MRIDPKQLHVRCVVPAGNPTDAWVNSEWAADYVGHPDPQQLRDAVLQHHYQTYCEYQQRRDPTWPGGEDRMAVLEDYMRWLHGHGYTVFQNDDPGFCRLQMGEAWD